MRRVMSAILWLALVPSLGLAQGPDFSGLPSTAPREDLAALVQQLLKRVAELERRVDALEGSQARTNSSEGTNARK